MNSKIDLLISDENRLFREGLNLILSSHNMDVVGEVRSLAEATALLRTLDRRADAAQESTIPQYLPCRTARRPS